MPEKEEERDEERKNTLSVMQFPMKIYFFYPALKSSLLIIT